MADYLIKDIPADTIKDFKTACAHFKESMRTVLIRLMEVQIAAYQVDISKFYKGRTRTKKKE